jgi:O-antigen ligase
MAAICASPFVVGPPDAIDGIIIGKGVLVVVAGALVLGVGLAAAGRSQELKFGRDPAVVAAGLFVATFVVATGLAPNPALAISGDLTRWNGLALYAACAVLFVAAGTRFSRDNADVAVRALVLAGALLGALAVAEYLGLHEFGGSDVTGARATLGNPNVLAGWLAIALPVCLLVALDPRQDPLWRQIGGGAAALAVLGTFASGSLQGPLAGAAGSSIVVLAWMADRRPRGQVRLAAIGTLTLAIMFLVVGAFGTQGHGPLSALGDQAGVQQRGYYWQAAVSMAQESPVTGVGPGHFEENYRQHRPVEEVLGKSLQHSADSAHSVPLDMAAAGGLPLLAAYVGWLALVAWRLWVGLRSTDGGTRLLLAGIGGGWLAYVAQSLVSIDVPPLAVLGWVFGGLVIGVAGVGEMWRIGVPWASEQRPDQSASRWVSDLGAVALVAVAAWFAFLPLRADAGAIQGELTPSGEIDPSSGVVQAARIADWEPAFGMQLLRAYIVTDNSAAAQEVGEALVERHPQSFDAALSTARLAVENGDLGVATRLYQHTLELEPSHPDVLLEVATHARDVEDFEWARSLIERVLSTVPGHPEASALEATL